jgi:F-type H+-transporting ATPase subunit delta
MSVHRIASRYAKSLLDLAREQNKLDAVRKDLEGFRTAVANRDFLLMLKSPLIHADKKTSILNAIFQGKVQDLTLQFLHIVVRKGRESLLPEIAHAFEQQFRELHRILSVRLTTATAVDPDLQHRIGQHLADTGLAKGEIYWDTHTDPTLIGGFVLEFDDKRYDASVAYQLAQLRKEVLA